MMKFTDYSRNNYVQQERKSLSSTPSQRRQERSRVYVLSHPSSSNHNVSNIASTQYPDRTKTLPLVWSSPYHERPSSDPSKRGNTENSHDRRSLARIFRELGKAAKQVCCDLFLPIGYPHTVAQGYLEYQCYDSIQGLCSYLRGVVSTGAVLMAAGVGDAEATAMSAAMTWAIRDGLGMIGGLLFSYVASPHFDAHVKEFRLMADILNDVGLTLDMALPVLMTWEFPWFHSFLSPYLVVTSFSTLCKVACGISAGATKGNITDHFSLGGNRADVNAKESTQETLVSLVGMALGVWLTKFLHSLEKLSDTQRGKSSCTNYESDKEGYETCHNFDQNETRMTGPMISWSIFLLLTFVHVWANYVGVQRLRLRTLNRERATVALQEVIEECGRWSLSDKKNDKAGSPVGQEYEMNKMIQKCIEKIPSPENVSESLWKSIFGMFYVGNIRLGIRVKDLVQMSSTKSNTHSMSSKWSQEKWDFLRDEYHRELYMIVVDTVGSGIGQRNFQLNVSVMMRLGANDHHELKAFLHAHILMWCMDQELAKISNERSWGHQQSTAIHRSRIIVNHFFSGGENSPHFLINALSEKGWDVSRLYLGFSPWKCDWDFGKMREE